MSDDIEIIDNFLPVDDWKKLNQTLLETPSTENFWSYCPGVIVGEAKTDSFMFVRMVYAYDKPNHIQDFELFAELFLKKLKVLSLQRIRMVLYPRECETKYHGWHTDFPVYKPGMMTAIYYVNETDGGTAFKNRVIEGKSNRMVIFPTNLEHTSISHTDKKARLVINFNYF